MNPSSLVKNSVMASMKSVNTFVVSSHNSPTNFHASSIFLNIVSALMKPKLNPDMNDDILGSSYRAEMRLSDAQVKARSLEQFGPSIALNPNITEALKFHKFKGEYTELHSNSEGFLVNWLLELNNTVGKRNGQFGNIVLWNAHKPQDEVVAKLVNFISTPEGEILAKRFAIYDEVGIQNFAERIYADATYALRDSSGRINNKLG